MARKKARTAPPPASLEGGAGRAVAAAARWQPVILKQPSKPSARLAEVAGGTAAGCAAVCCCCPCGLANLLVLMVVRLPAVLCQRALKARTKRRAVIKKPKDGRFGSKQDGSGGRVRAGNEEGVGLHGAVAVAVAGEAWPAKPPPAEATEMEKEMWAKFCAAGFWRSPSQREEEEERP
ncbi:uncharacterized protein [Elaeis guineensis]|uniref:Uncharacterized protein LOC105035598 n=1 Tax=Elaeis guineensis var. tenera TaxID=51953 RepID=A0A8N4IBI8_ELAGV|nr:uncharacterized protein LOC105035598 [Elaeis guineensis]